MKRTTTNIIFLISLSLLVFSGALYAYLYFSFENVAAGTAKLYEETEESRASYEELTKVKENLKTTLGAKNRLESLFIKQDSIVDFIQVIELMMKTNGVSGSVENVSEVQTPELSAIGKEELHVSLAISGDWNNVLKFQGLLEKIPYKTTINAANLTYVKNEKVAGWRENVTLILIAEKLSEAGASGEEANTTQKTDEEL